MIKVPVPYWFNTVIEWWQDGLIDDMTYINAYNWINVKFVWVTGFF